MKKQTTNYYDYGIEKASILISVILMASILTSCVKKDQDISKDDESYILKYVSSSIKELKSIDGENVTDIDIKYSESIFGKDINLITPIELKFDDTQLTIVKLHGIEEIYDIQWRERDLFIKNGIKNTWRYCGSLNETNQFVLNIGSYSIESQSEQRMLYISGHDYSITSYDKINYIEGSLNWMKLESIFD